MLFKISWFKFEIHLFMIQLNGNQSFFHQVQYTSPCNKSLVTYHNSFPIDNTSWLRKEKSWYKQFHDKLQKANTTCKVLNLQGKKYKTLEYRNVDSSAEAV